MEIKQYKSFQFNRLNNNYQVLNYGYFESPISHVISCLESCYYYVLRYGGPVKFVLFLDDIGIGFNELDISVDSKNDLIYTSEQFFAENYEHCMTKEEFDIKSENMTNLELYQHDFLTHAVMTKNNFI